ncbi:FTR1 family protein [Piscinibacter sp.]|uniref:FTR1 family iron permease n=1 Tax=Piscinibacter sp. TaxID=1903157 RepID=UPI0035B0892F
MLNTLVVVWRESLEAMLVVGILLGWIGRQADPAPLRRGLWAGVAAGVALALLLGVATFAAQSQMQGQALELFQLAMVLLAVVLVSEMVFWMHRHGRAMKRELEARAAQRASVLGIAAIAAIAVAREGTETAIFLYGIVAEAAGASLAGLLAAALAGFALAALTAAVVARGARWISYRAVFAVSEAALLLIGAALLAHAIDRLIGLDWLPPGIDPLWDSSALLDDSRGAGRLLADFTGYRARPCATLVAGLALYWAYVGVRLRAGSGANAPVPRGANPEVAP